MKFKSLVLVTRQREPFKASLRTSSMATLLLALTIFRLSEQVKLWELMQQRTPGIYILHKPHKLKLSGRRSTDLRYKKRCFCNVENSSRWSIYRQC